MSQDRIAELRRDLHQIQTKERLTVDDVGRVDQIADTIARAVEEKSR